MFAIKGYESEHRNGENGVAVDMLKHGDFNVIAENLM